jgi:membrane protease YdiL (CAAX protease family)
MIVFVLAQLIGTVLAIGLANQAPEWVARPGLGLEVLRGIPALLIILVVWLELAIRNIKVTPSLTQIFQRVAPVDVAAITLFNLAIGILSIVTILLSIHHYSPDSLREALTPSQSSLVVLWIGAATSTTLAPVSEEIVFRGWLFNGLRRRLHLWPAIILSSLAFAAIHPSISSFTTFIFGVSAAIVYYKTQNLWASILIHALNNLLISAQSIIEHVLIRLGLVNANASMNSVAYTLGLPSGLLAILLGVYLVRKKHFFNLQVPL